MTRFALTRLAMTVSILSAALAMPALASAHCGTVQGSFSVSCENGVKVFRHNAPSAIAQGMSAQEVQLEAAKLQQQTERERIAAQEAQARETARLREAELANERYRNRVYERNTRRRSTGFGYGYGFGGYRLARPLRVRPAH